MKQRSLCAWMIIVITWGESIGRTNCCTRTWSNGQEQKNDQMVIQTFQKAIELYSSQFICCLSTSDGKKYTAALVQNSASERSVYEICVCCGDVECTGTKGIWEHSSTADWKAFSEKSGTQNWKIKTSEEVFCVLKAQKIEILKTVYCCEICDVCPCLEDCFELYHTKLNYWGNDNYLMHLYSFKISVLKFWENRIISLRIMIF